MRNIDVAVIIDVEGALSSGSLQGNVYLVDTNKYLGSWQQGQSDLHTICQDGQIVTWWASPINPGNDSSIIEFSGQMLSSKVCDPKRTALAGESAWAGQVQSRGSVGSYPYTISVSLGGKAMTFSALLKVV